MLGDHRGRADKAELAKLLGELDAGRFDSAIALRWQSSPDPFAAMFRAIALALAARPSEAVVEAQRASAMAPGSTLLRTVAARLFYALRLFSESMAELGAAATTAPAKRTGASALDWKFELERRLGWFREALSTVDEAWAIDPESTGRLTEAAELLFITRDFEGALHQIDKGLSRRADSTGLHMKKASLLLRLARWDEVAASVEAGIRLSPRLVALRLDGARHLLGAGAWTEAERHLRAAVELDGGCAPAVVGLAQLRLWVGDYDGAIKLADAALSVAAEHAAAFRIRGAAQVMLDKLDEGLADLDRATSLDERDFEAHIWRGEVLLRRGKFDEAFAQLNRGGEMSEDYADYVAAQFLRLLVQIGQGNFPGLPEYVVPDALDAIFPGELALLDPADLEGLTKLLRRALAAMQGNRAFAATFVADAAEDALRPIRVRPSPRGPSKEALWLVTTNERDTALAGFARVHATYPRSPEPWCYHGELHLYLGEYSEARACFEQALAIYSKTRWAFIGLGATSLLEGQPEETLEVLARGIEFSRGPGPTTYIYRGEAYRKLGRLDEAISDLRHSTQTTPTRVSAWANLALALDDQGDHRTPLEIHARLLRQAAGLMSDVSRALAPVDGEAQSGVVPSLRSPSPRELRAIFEKLLELQRGNRSSTCVTYFTHDGKLRTVPPTLDLTDAYVERELRQLRHLLERSLGLA